MNRPLKLLLDQCLPRSTVELLAHSNISAEYVGPLGMASAMDEEILEYAHQQEAAVVSLDSDFHAILARQGAAAPSVIRIRIEGLTAVPLTELLCRVLPTIDAQLEIGSAVTVTQTQVRIRSLPIGKKAR